MESVKPFCLVIYKTYKLVWMPENRINIWVTSFYKFLKLLIFRPPCREFFLSRETKATGGESKATAAQVQRPAADKSADDSDDDIEIIEEIKIKPTVKRVVAGMECYAVRSGDLWKRGIVVQVIGSAGGRESDEVSMCKIIFIT